jgi:hypothetical protein
MITVRLLEISIPRDRDFVGTLATPEDEVVITAKRDTVSLGGVLVQRLTVVLTLPSRNGGTNTTLFIERILD